MDYRELTPLETGFAARLEAKLEEIRAATNRTRQEMRTAVVRVSLIWIVIGFAIAFGALNVVAEPSGDWAEQRWFVAVVGVSIMVGVPVAVRRQGLARASDTAAQGVMDTVCAFVGGLTYTARVYWDRDIESLAQAGLLPAHDKCEIRDLLCGQRDGVDLSLTSCRLRKSLPRNIGSREVFSGRFLRLSLAEGAPAFPRLHLQVMDMESHGRLPLPFRAATPLQTGDARIDTRFVLRPADPGPVCVPPQLVTALIVADRETGTGGSRIRGGLIEADSVTLVFEDRDPMLDLVDDNGFRSDGGKRLNKAFRMIGLAMAAASALGGMPDERDAPDR